MSTSSTVLTGLFIHDKDHGTYTAFFKEIPEAAAQGNTQEEAEENLFKQLPMIIEAREEFKQEELDECEDDGSLDIFEKQYSFTRP